MKIANYRVDINKECPEKLTTALNKYWALEDLKFITAPLKIANEFKLSLYELKLAIKEYSSVSFYLHCKKCNSYEKQATTSQSNFTDIIRTNKYSNTCLNCIETEIETKKSEIIERNKRKFERQNEAIENKSWKSLNTFQKQLLIDVIETNNFRLLTGQYYKKPIDINLFWSSLYYFDQLDLIDLLKSEWNNRIEDISFLPILKNYISEISNSLEVSKSNVKFDTSTNELKFVLTKNNSCINSDSPTYSGTLKFPERITLEPNMEYTFGAWSRTNGNLYLSIIPIENIYNHPKQNSLKNLPVHIKDIIEQFFENRIIMDN